MVIHLIYINSLNILSTSAMDKMASINAEKLAIKEGNSLIGNNKYGVQPLKRASLDLVNEKSIIVSKLLEKQGCLSVKEILSKDSCIKLKEFISNEVINSKNDVNSDNNNIQFNERFGGVNCRGTDIDNNIDFGKRQDLYLPLSNEFIRTVTAEAFKNLLPIIENTVGINGLVHEISSLVSNPGSPRQCLHCDTIYLPCPQYPSANMEPLYTFFIALQDVEDNMGHTLFLPQTHTESAHLMWNTEQSKKEKFIQVNPAVESRLKIGDTAIFDSRLLHCGRENTSTKVRTLFYFTLSKQHQWPLKNGLHGSNSIRKEDFQKWTVKDVLDSLET